MTFTISMTIVQKELLDSTSENAWICKGTGQSIQKCFRIYRLYGLQNGKLPHCLSLGRRKTISLSASQACPIWRIGFSQTASMWICTNLCHRLSPQSSPILMSCQSTTQTCQSIHLPEIPWIYCISPQNHLSLLGSQLSVDDIASHSPKEPVHAMLRNQRDSWTI